MRVRTLLAWIAVGLVGLALAAGVTYAATQLSNQRIGLSAEPASAGEELVPPQRAPRTRPATAPAAAPSPAARGEDRDDPDRDDERREPRGRSGWDD